MFISQGFTMKIEQVGHRHHIRWRGRERKRERERLIYRKGLASPSWGWQAARNQGRSWGYRPEVEFLPHQDALSPAPVALHLTESGPVDDLKRSPFLKLMTHFNHIYKIPSQELLGQRLLNTWGPSPTQTDTQNRASLCGVTGLGHPDDRQVLP